MQQNIIGYSYYLIINVPIGELSRSQVKTKGIPMPLVALYNYLFTFPRFPQFLTSAVSIFYIFISQVSLLNSSHKLYDDNNNNTQLVARHISMKTY